MSIIFMSALTVGIIIAILFFVGILADIPWMVYTFGGILMVGLVSMLVIALYAGWVQALGFA